VDVLRQLFAVRRALEALGVRILEGHLNTCVLHGIRDGREKEVLKELVELYSLSNR
jgi:DNA-binding FrmR family transcriptional regulator